MAGGYSSFIKKHLGGAGAFVPLVVDPVAYNKRAMMIAFDAPYRTILPLPDGAITVADRYQLARKYHGLSAPTAALIFRNRTASRMRFPTLS